MMTRTEFQGNDMTQDAWFEAIKTLGIIVSGGLGIFGVLGEFRTKGSRKIKPLGYWMLGGIALSVALTVVATIHDDQAHAIEIANLQAGTAKVQIAVTRARLPIETHIPTRFQFIIPPDTDEAKAAIAMLEQKVPGLLTDPARAANELGSNYLVTGRAGKPPIVSIPPRFFGGALQLLASRLNISLDVFGRASPCCELGKGDLQAVGYVSGLQQFGAPHLNSALYQWNTETHTLSVVGWYDAQVFKRSDPVFAFPDLVGATIILSTFQRGSDPASDALLSSLEAGELNVAFSIGQPLWIPASAFTRSTGTSSFTTRLPGSDDEFDKLKLAMPP
jgi:hypothetical protein